MARVRLLPVRIRQRIAQSKNVVNLNDIDDMLLESPEEDIRDDKGVWKLQRRSYKDGYTQLIVSQMEWKNIAKNEAIVPECSTDPVELERMRCEEPLREDFIENPLAEEQTRRERARGIWTEKKTSKLCATLAKTDYKFGRAAEKMKVPRGDCVEHWYSYKRNEKHIENCEACTKQRNKKKKRKEAAALVTAADEVRAVAALAAAAVKPQQPSMSFAREPSEEEEIDVENGDPPPRELWVDPDILAAIAATTPILPSQSDEDDIDVQPSTSFARETSEEENIDIENGDPPQRDLWVDRDVLGAIAASAPPLPTESDKDEIDVDSGSTEVAMRILACDSTIDPQEKRGDNMPSGDWETMGLNILAEAAVSATPLQLTESGQDGFDVDCTGSLKRSQELHQRLERGAKPCDTCDIAGLNILAAVAATSTPFPTAKPGEDEVRGNAGRELKTKNFFSASLRKRSHEGRNSLHSPRATATRAALDHDDIEDGAAPRKRSRAGRRIVVPWRFRNEPQRGRQY